MPSLTAIALLALATAVSAQQPAAAAAVRPNVIIILADDLGYGDLGCYGQKRIKTPVIDRLAAEGLRFTDHYAGSTVCAPSRCVLMTGLHTGHCQIRNNQEVQPMGQAPLRAGTATVARLMQQAGYATALIGKWGLGGPGSTGVPNQQPLFSRSPNDSLAPHARQSFKWTLNIGKLGYWVLTRQSGCGSAIADAAAQSWRRPELGTVSRHAAGLPSVPRENRSLRHAMKPQSRGTGCVNRARPDQWGASSGLGAGRPYPGTKRKAEFSPTTPILLGLGWKSHNLGLGKETSRRKT